jgi:hypothetical protein
MKIVANITSARAVRKRSVPFSSFAHYDEPILDPHRFHPAGD